MTTKRERGTTFLVERIPDALWKRAKAKAASEGRTMRWVVLELVAYYVNNGLPTERKS